LGIKQTVHILRRSPRFAVLLWLVLAFLVWNVVFDRVLVLAGRQYTSAAVTALHQGQGYLLINDWMRPAIAYGVRVATGVALGVAVFGWVAVGIASRLDRRRHRRE
jgi:energy-coupling factor transporter transmembrane protein EcfT